MLEAEQLQLSFNNLLDADAWKRRRPMRGLTQPAVAIVEHTIPCGLAERGDLATAFEEALRGDPGSSAFGGIVTSTAPSME